MPIEYRNQIVTGDARELAKRIPDESIDLIFTDPPYHKRYVFLFDALARMASTVLKLGGLLITLSGQAAFNYAFHSLSEHLDYYWISNMPHSLGCIGRYHPRQMMCGSKPMLWFSRGKPAPHPYVFDTFLPKRCKEFHEWGQPAEWFMYYIDKLTSASDVVLDPFAGGGTVAAVCKILDRNYIAFEIDPDTAQLARERVANTQPPLFVPEPEQLSLLT